MGPEYKGERKTVLKKCGGDPSRYLEWTQQQSSRCFKAPPQRRGSKTVSFRSNM